LIGDEVKKEDTKDDDTKPIKRKQVYAIRDVIKQNYRTLIEDEIPYVPSDKQYIGSYQRAVTTVHKNMSKSELEKVEETVEMWNKQGAPPQVKLK
jgi:hypothetical protein